MESESAKAAAVGLLRHVVEWVCSAAEINADLDVNDLAEELGMEADEHGWHLELAARLRAALGTAEDGGGSGAQGASEDRAAGPAEEPPKKGTP